jgi:hypothetical protein
VLAYRPAPVYIDGMNAKTTIPADERRRYLRRIREAEEGLDRITEAAPDAVRIGVALILYMQRTGLRTWEGTGFDLLRLAGIGGRGNPTDRFDDAIGILESCGLGLRVSGDRSELMDWMAVEVEDV